MHPVIIFALGLIAGFLIARFIKKDVPQMNPKAQELKDKKEKNKERIIMHLKEHGSITNDGVEDLLGVGNTTAYRYLEELEEEGAVEQVGKTGRNVEYRLIN